MPLRDPLEGITGVLELVNKTHGHFGAADEACVASFGRLCAVTLQNARLLQVARSAQAKRVSE